MRGSSGHSDLRRVMGTHAPPDLKNALSALRFRMSLEGRNALVTAIFAIPGKSRLRQCGQSLNRRETAQAIRHWQAASRKIYRRGAHRTVRNPRNRARRLLLAEPV